MPLGCAFAKSFIAKTTLIGIFKYLVKKTLFATL